MVPSEFIGWNNFFTQFAQTDYWYVFNCFPKFSVEEALLIHYHYDLVMEILLFTYYCINPTMEKVSFTLYPNSLVIKMVLLVILKIQRWRYYFPHSTLRTWRWRYHIAEYYSSTGRAEQVPSISHVWPVPNVYTCITCRTVRTKSQCKSRIKAFCFAVLLVKYLKANET